MKCPKCQHEFKDPAKVAGGKASRRKAGPRCPVHGTFLKNGKCKRCDADTVYLIREAGAFTWHIARSLDAIHADCGEAVPEFRETFTFSVKELQAPLKNWEIVCKQCKEVTDV